MTVAHVPRKKKAALSVRVRKNPLTPSGLHKRWVPVAHTSMRFRAPCEWHADQCPGGANRKFKNTFCASALGSAGHRTLEGVARVSRGLGKGDARQRVFGGTVEIPVEQGLPQLSALVLLVGGCGTSTDSLDPTTRALRPKYGCSRSWAITSFRTRPG